MQLLATHGLDTLASEILGRYGFIGIWTGIEVRKP